MADVYFVIINVVVSYYNGVGNLPSDKEKEINQVNSEIIY